MENNARMLFLRYDYKSFLKGEGFLDSPIPGDEFTASERHIDHCLDGLKSELTEEKFKAVQEIVLSVVK